MALRYWIMFFTGIIVGSSVLINIFKMADNTVDVDLQYCFLLC